MAAAEKAPWAICVVALLAQGVPTATSLMVQVNTSLPERIHGEGHPHAYDDQVACGTTFGFLEQVYGVWNPAWSGDTYFACVSMDVPSKPWMTAGMVGMCRTAIGIGSHQWQYCATGGFHSNPCAGIGDGSIFFMDCQYMTLPTPAPDTGGAAAIGDPHLQNVHGERFDLMKPGKHVLINIPRGMSAENALLRVQADARRLGGHCADMYFQELNITGSWAEAKQDGGYHYSASQSDDKSPKWLAFGSASGKVELKVVHGSTGSGLQYLNVYVKHLGRAGFAVGGLLGEDDHRDVMIPPTSCDHRMSLLEVQTNGQAQL